MDDITSMSDEEYIDRLIHWLRVDSDNYSQCRLWMHDPSVNAYCAYGGFLDTTVVKEGLGHWYMRDTPDKDYGVYSVLLTSNDPFIRSIGMPSSIQAQARWRMCTLNDTTDLTFKEIGDIMEQEREKLIRGEVWE